LGLMMEQRRLHPLVLSLGFQSTLHQIAPRSASPLPHPPSTHLHRSNPLINLTRSGKRTELIKLLLDTDTPVRLRDALDEALRRHCMTGVNASDFSGEPKVRYTGINEQGKARVVIVFTFAYGGE